MLKSYTMQFDGQLLQRGFWLYVWSIRAVDSHHVYVGRTGDTSSPNASSPFRRIGQHLDPGSNAKGNALGKALKKAGINSHHCTFEMIAIGPIFAEQSTFTAHIPVRDKVAAVERAVADELRGRGYSVLGRHPRQSSPDPLIIQDVFTLIDPTFPGLPRP